MNVMSPNPRQFSWNCRLWKVRFIGTHGKVFVPSDETNPQSGDAISLEHYFGLLASTRNFWVHATCNVRFYEHEVNNLRHCGDSCS